jgi:hypothetical protein
MGFECFGIKIFNGNLEFLGWIGEHNDPYDRMDVLF